LLQQPINTSTNEDKIGTAKVFIIFELTTSGYYLNLAVVKFKQGAIEAINLISGKTLQMEIRYNLLVPFK
jgi:hypothetical protein